MAKGIILDNSIVVVQKFSKITITKHIFVGGIVAILPLFEKSSPTKLKVFKLLIFLLVT
jgi:hypothetical protein